MVKGIETNSKCTASLLLSDQFVASFDDKTLGVYTTEALELDHIIPLNGVASSLAPIDNNTFLTATDENKLFLIDKRMPNISLTLPTNTSEHIHDIKKIYPSTILYSQGKALKIFDLKIQKELFSCKLDEVAANLEILNSDVFVASGKNLHLWKGVN